MASTATARTHDREATCNAILDATGEIISEKGLDGFTISEISRRANVNRALIYHYYQNRENLVTHAIDRIMERNNIAETSLSGEAVARNARNYIEHPEIGRLVFHLILSGRPLLRLGERLHEQIDHINELMKRQFPNAEEDPTFTTLILAFSCFAWSFAREELADVLGLSLEEADDRFVNEISRVSEVGLQQLAERLDAMRTNAAS
jgi:AcrR family transcriptional regulator